MGWGFRKSFSLGKGMRVNLSKSGLGVSIGGKGFRVGANSRGAYSSVGIPGTGIYHRSSLSSGKERAKTGRQSCSADSSEWTVVGCLWTLAIGSCIVGLIVYPSLGILGFAVLLVGYFLYANTPAKKSRALTNQAIKLLDQGKQENALKNLEKARNLNKSDIHTLAALVNLYMTREEFEKCLECCIDLLGQNSITTQGPSIQHIMGTCYFNLREYKEAISIFQEIPETYSDYIKVLLAMGSAFHELGELDLAIETFRRAPLRKRNLDEDLMKVHYLLGVCFKEKGDRNQALRHLKRVYAVDMDFMNIQVEIRQLQ